MWSKESSFHSSTCEFNRVKVFVAFVLLGNRMAKTGQKVDISNLPARIGPDISLRLLLRCPI